MIMEANAYSKNKKDRRQQRGTWPWFVLNVILFPAPAYLTLLRVREVSFGKSLKHLGLTSTLIFILILSALLQLIFPAIGRLWMILPVISGFLVLYANISLRKNFHSFNIGSITKKQNLYYFVFFVLLFTVLSVLPDLDLIELNKDSAEVYKAWIGGLPFWQELLILVSGLLLLQIGYLTNSTEPFSINRAFILYACFVIFISFFYLVLYLVFDWLKIQGSFWTHFIIFLVSAIMAIDYWDVRSFGQYTRRFVFLTCTKSFSFIFLWLCLLGLPQKAASDFSANYFNKSRPAITQHFNKHLIITDRDRFESIHEASRRIRSLYTRALYRSSSEELKQINTMINENKGIIFPPDTDICSLADLIIQKSIKSSSISFDSVPVFRPVHHDWDVMLTSLLSQGIISGADLNKFIADLKKMLPDTSQGRLPDINTSSRARYVSLATNTRVDFIPPEFDLIEKLVKRNICPVLSLRLAGKDYWAALLHMDHQSGIAWFRIETLSDMEESIQVLFDSNEATELREEILSRIMIPLSIEYFRNALKHYSEAAIVFTPEGLDKALPDLFAKNDLLEIKQALLFASDPAHSTPLTFNAPQNNLFLEYAENKYTIALIKALLEPSGYKENLFFRPIASSFEHKGLARLSEIQRLLDQVKTMRDCDRIDIVSLMVANNHVNGARDLFMRLVSEKICTSDLVDCGDAFNTGREVFLLGYHEKAYDFFNIAYSRHPFNAEYEMWHHITELKLDKPQSQFYSPPWHEPDLYMYYRILKDIQDGDKDSALERLEKALKQDSHNSLAVHLMSKYFDGILDERHFFPSQEGL